MSCIPGFGGDEEYEEPLPPHDAAEMDADDVGEVPPQVVSKDVDMDGNLEDAEVENDEEPTTADSQVSQFISLST